MSWRCSANSNEGLVANLCRYGLVTTEKVKEAMIKALESMFPRLGPGSRVLDIGCGSGYLTAVLAHLVVPGGKIVGVEHIQQLCDLSIENLRKDPVHAKMLDDGTIKIVKGDGRLGYPGEGPYDAIHVGAAASEFHQPLIDQLKSPGRMFIPVQSGSFNQYIWEVDKDKDGHLEKKRMSGVLYVPLTDAREYNDQ
ncbi:hypothetical protein RUND412_008512 [Rhizina undulata]